MVTQQETNLYQDSVQRALAALPEYERAAVEAMVFELCDIRGIGARTALDIICKAGRYLLAAKRERWRNGRA